MGGSCSWKFGTANILSAVVIQYSLILWFKVVAGCICLWKLYSANSLGYYVPRCCSLQLPCISTWLIFLSTTVPSFGGLHLLVDAIRCTNPRILCFMLWKK